MSHFKRRALCAVAACALGLGAVGATTPVLAKVAVEPAAATARAGKPNVLFILLDDLRPDIGVYGNPVAQTPNMDALAASGLVFEHAYTQQAVCGPSRAALMTGLRPDTTGITTLNQPVDKTIPNAVTLTDTFRNAGYATAAFGKIYHHQDDDADGWTEGKSDVIYEMRRAARQAGQPNNAVIRAAGRDGLADTINVEAALTQMSTLAQGEKPFFLAVGIHRPHLPFEAPEADFARYDGRDIPGPVNPEGQRGAPPYALVSYEVWNYADTPDRGPMPADKVQELREAYLASVSYADGLVGDLLAGLKAQGLDENTIVVLWGDHGFKLGDHGAWAKHSTSELDIHIPLIVRAPGVTRAGTRTDALVETVDVYPTLAELAGLEAPTNLEGLSMAPVLRNPDIPWKQAAFAQYPRNGNESIQSSGGRRGEGGVSGAVRPQADGPRARRQGAAADAKAAGPAGAAQEGSARQQQRQAERQAERQQRREGQQGRRSPAQNPHEAAARPEGGARSLMGYTVRTDRYRYTAWVRRQDQQLMARELYDMQNDPDETVNIAEDPRQAEAVRELEALRLRGWRGVREDVLSRR